MKTYERKSSMELTRPFVASSDRQMPRYPHPYKRQNHYPITLPVIMATRLIHSSPPTLYPQCNSTMLQEVRRNRGAAEMWDSPVTTGEKTH
jgi:hypothetical protein